jgi:HPt (histidine-containing phosphotransfer) domain-containing protein
VLPCAGSRQYFAPGRRRQQTNHPRNDCPVPLNSAFSDWIPWMPSPPLAPDEGYIDTVHLTQMTLGDEVLKREVLTLFVRQSADLVARMATFPADMAAIAHTLKGSARGIGAFSAATSAERLEQAGDRGAARAALSELKDTISETVRAIDEILAIPRA